MMMRQAASLRLRLLGLTALGLSLALLLAWAMLGELFRAEVMRQRCRPGGFVAFAFAVGRKPGQRRRRPG